MNTNCGARSANASDTVWVNAGLAESSTISVMYGVSPKRSTHLRVNLVTDLSTSMLTSWPPLSIFFSIRPIRIVE